MNGVQVGGVGNLTRDPELRFTANGVPWVTFSIAVNKYRGSGDQRTETTVFLSCKAWRDMAENIAESLKKGDRCYVEGTLETEEWTDREGQKRTSQVVLVDDCGPSLRWAQAQVTRNARNGGGSNASRSGGSAASDSSGGGYGGAGGYGGGSTVPAEDAAHDPFGMPDPSDEESPF